MCGIKRRDVFFLSKKEHNKRGLENVRQTVRQLLLLLQFCSDGSILVIKPENIRKVFIYFTCLTFCQVIIRKESKLGIFLIFTKEYMSLTNKHPTKIIWVIIDPSLYIGL